MKDINNLWYPYRWGLKIRKKLLKFASSYGSKYIKIRRPVAVFISALLDENHQELHDKTIEYHYKNQK